MKKPGMTAEEHRASGAKLSEMQEEIGHLHCLYSAKYPHTASRALGKMYELLEQFRSDMDKYACREHRQALGRGFMKLYYPGAKGGRS